MRRWSQGNEELTPVRPRPAVGHAKRPFGSMLKLRVEFIFKLAAVDGGASTAGAGRLQLMSAYLNSTRRARH